MEAAYRKFSNIFNKTNNSTVKIDNDLLSSKNINAYITKVKNDAIRRRDLQNGYNEDEVLSEGSNASYVKGILVKSKEEIKNIAEGLQGKNTNAQNMSLDEFAEFLYCL